MIDLQTISIVLACASVCVAALYYTFTLRYTRMNMKITLETRQFQIFMQLYQQLNSEDSFRTWAELMILECKNYDEFLRKYDSSVNPDSFGKRSHIWWSYHTIGALLQEGLIEPDLVYRLLGPLVIMQWVKWSSIIEEIREKENNPELFEMFEYLSNEMKKIHEQRNYPELRYPQPYRDHPELKT